MFLLLVLKYHPETFRKDPRNTLLQTLCKDNIDGFLLDKSYDQGNETAIKIYHYTGEKLGQGLALVANLFSPEAFIFMEDSVMLVNVFLLPLESQ